jgi:hypothetical protein
VKPRDRPLLPISPSCRPPDQCIEALSRPIVKHSQEADHPLAAAVTDGVVRPRRIARASAASSAENPRTASRLRKRGLSEARSIKFISEAAASILSRCVPDEEGPVMMAVSVGSTPATPRELWGALAWVSRTPHEESLSERLWGAVRRKAASAIIRASHRCAEGVGRSSRAFLLVGIPEEATLPSYDGEPLVVRALPALSTGGGGVWGRWEAVHGKTRLLTHEGCLLLASGTDHRERALPRMKWFQIGTAIRVMDTSCF